MFRHLLLPITFVALATFVAAHPQPVSAQTANRDAGKAVGGGVVNINTAAAADFEGLPGIGAKTAARIVEYRQKNGPFKKVEELMNVRGVGEKSFLKLKPQLVVGAPKADANGAK